MGDEPKKPKVEDRTVEVSNEELKALRESAHSIRAELSHTRPQPRVSTLDGAKAGTPTQGNDIRDILKQAAQLRAAAGDVGGETKSIRRDNLVELLKGELKEASAADEAPSVGILKHTRTKEETPLQLLALGRKPHTTPSPSHATPVPSHETPGGAMRPSSRSGIEQLSRAMGFEEEEADSTREVSVIPELMTKRPPRSQQDPTVVGELVSPRDLAALFPANEDSNATRELGSMPELIAMARGMRDLEQSTVVQQFEESSDYSLIEIAREEAGMDEESAASLHLSAKAVEEPTDHVVHEAAHTAPAPPQREEPLIEAPCAEAPHPEAPHIQTPEPQAAPAIHPSEAHSPALAPAQEETMQEETMQESAGEQSVAVAAPATTKNNSLIGRTIAIGVGAAVTLLGLAGVFDHEIMQMWLAIGITVGGVSVVALALRLGHNA
jgi:hypothetical protein